MRRIPVTPRLLLLLLALAGMSLRLSAQPVRERVLTPSVDVSPTSSFVGSSARPLNGKQMPRIPSHVLPQALPDPKYKTSGKEFYFIILAAVGDQNGVNSPKRIYISSRSHTRGKITLVAGGYEQHFEVNPHVLTPVQLPPTAMLDRRQTENAYKRLYKVETEDECAVYGMSNNNLSSDGFLVLPEEALGTKYVVASMRNSLWYYEGAVKPWYANINVPRSQFAVGAIEDGTTVTVQLSADSYTGRYVKGFPYQFVLNKGEVLPIMAKDTGMLGPVDFYDAVTQSIQQRVEWVAPGADFDCDLTGSIITSDKPVVVYSGHERASVPAGIEFGFVDHPNTSRDHLIDQMPPVELWGKEFVVIGSMQDDRNSRPLGGDLLRVMTFEDDNECYVNGTLRSTIKQNQYFELMSGDLAHIKTSKPALVVKYMQTADNLDPDSVFMGDPDMTVVPPIENMATEFTLPTTSMGLSFEEHYLNILLDSSALTQTTLNGLLVEAYRFQPVPGTRFLWARMRTFAGEQRLESSLPCYAESYGYGIFDSYSYSGGGGYKYIRGLEARDLNFGFLRLGEMRDSVTTVFATIPQGAISDSIDIFRLTWRLGDTTEFGMMDTLRQPIRLAPGDTLPVRFRFTPSRLGTFTARVQVWSSNETDVYINLLGAAGDNDLDVDPPMLDFGKLRPHKSRALLFDLIAHGQIPVALAETDWQPYLRSGGFTTDKYTQQNPLPFEVRVGHEVVFAPPARGYYRDTIYFLNNGGDVPTEIVFGRCIEPDIRSVDTNFGLVRFDREQSAWYDIPVANIGDDSTSVVSITLFDGDITEFELNSVPPHPRWLDTLYSSNSSLMYRARFAPRSRTVGVPDLDGARMARVRIVTTDSVYFHILRGTGVEPWLVSTPDTIDFGVIDGPPLVDVLRRTLPINIENIGSSDGIISSLENFTSNFEIQAQPSFVNYLLSDAATTEAQIDFKISAIGAFFDSIVVTNDSRTEPIAYLRARVRPGVEIGTDIDLGVISNCLPIDTVIEICTNPNGITIGINDISIGGDTAGFSLPELPNIVFPFNLPAGEKMRLRLRYEFPNDLADGTQRAFIVITTPTISGENIVPRYDTIWIDIERKITTLSLDATPPPYNPNALDEPFRIPIYLKGDRSGKPQLDNISVVLNFSNEMLEPIGVDRTGSLTDRVTYPNIPVQQQPVWDPVARTYVIPCTDIGVAANSSKNTLLVTVLTRAYLTQEVQTVVDQSLRFDVEEPCAYRVLSDSLAIDYADECGDATIRDVGTKGVILVLEAPRPDPVQRGAVAAVETRYLAFASAEISWKLYDLSGAVVTESQAPQHVSAGQGSFLIPTTEIQASGTYIIEVSTIDANGYVARTTTKFVVR